MAGSSNFLQFDANKTNMLDDANYSANAAIEDGVTSGIASSALHNKLFYQMTTFIAAFAQAMADAGFAVSDGDFNTLVQTIKNYNKISSSGIYVANDEITRFTFNSPFATAFTEIDLAAFIPDNTPDIKYAIINFSVYHALPNNSTPNDLFVRPHGSLGEGQLALRSNANGDGWEGVSNQMIVPIANKAFQYKWINPPTDGTAVFALQGWII